MTETEHSLAREAKAWPFEEARKVMSRLGGKHPEKGYVLFETGYGPSGLPHLGTFGEVLRTSMVRNAFQTLSDIPTRLISFSDDMDALRKVPDNIPKREEMARFIGFPLTRVPDPFGEHESFGHHNNARLKHFLDSFGFEYEFLSSSEVYKSGRFNAALLKVLELYDEVMAAILPTLGKERQATYSPFLPISPSTGRVLQVPVLERDVGAGTIIFEDEDGKKREVPVTDGHCKLQWKPDWGMRWYALGVDYEMSGKDLIDSVKQASKITRILGARPPETFSYEHFLDENGEKISKSRGNGLTMEEWLTYAPQESLAYYMYLKPKTAKRLYFDVIPKTVDDYINALEKFSGQTPAERMENPVWHIHGANPPAPNVPISFSMLLNLASAANTEDSGVLWKFITSYAPDTTPQSSPLLDRLVHFAIRYFQDFVKPAKTYRAPTDSERKALERLNTELEAQPQGANAQNLQTLVYTIGKESDLDDLKSWFSALYETLLGQPQGPRMGTFIALYGVRETQQLIKDALARA